MQTTQSLRDQQGGKRNVSLLVFLCFIVRNYTRSKQIEDSLNNWTFKDSKVKFLSLAKITLTTGTEYI